MDFVKIKTSEATGAALDWLVAKAMGLAVELTLSTPKAVRLTTHRDMFDVGAQCWGFAPSSKWAQGGPIKTRELIAMHPRFLAAGYQYPEGKWVWQAYLLGPDNLDDNHEQESESELVAAMRCYVASKLGDEAEVPEELLP